eukprot:TRINITY_DN5719_c0_g1_i6.p1 TRINITY_DN5719_c0_g1~~TRINITY_DN5719_c0_g1_i6.p1  ORF type:complete len:126 (-),score=19.01 TRINITY_DN5719_c0_g1_i6:325-678(-)
MLTLCADRCAALEKRLDQVAALQQQRRILQLTIPSQSLFVPPPSFSAPSRVDVRALSTFQQVPPPAPPVHTYMGPPDQLSLLGPPPPEKPLQLSEVSKLKDLPDVTKRCASHRPSGC